MGYALCYGRCIVCNQVFSFNPLRVPSIRVDGTREPVCRPCVEDYVNPKLIKLGKEPVKPAPDAYDAINEEELPND